MNQSADNKPRDARLVELLLQTAGIHDCDEQVVPMLLEFAFRYISDVLTESLLFADHAGRQSDISLDDVKLAIESRVNHSFTSPPPKDLLLEIAREKNNQPLPIIGEKYGIRLPPQQYTLTSVNYSIVPKPVREPSSKRAAAPPPPQARPQQPSSAGDAGAPGPTPEAAAPSSARPPSGVSIGSKPPTTGASVSAAATVPAGAGGDETDEEMEDAH